LKILENS